MEDHLASIQKLPSLRNISIKKVAKPISGVSSFPTISLVSSLDGMHYTDIRTNYNMLPWPPKDGPKHEAFAWCEF